MTDALFFCFRWLKSHKQKPDRFGFFFFSFCAKWKVQFIGVEDAFQNQSPVTIDLAPVARAIVSEHRDQTTLQASRDAPPSH